MQPQRQLLVLSMALVLAASACGGGGGGSAVTARLSANVTSGKTPLTVLLDASGSTASTPITRYTFDWQSDGTVDLDNGADPTVEHGFFLVRTYHVKLRAYTASGAFGEATLDITVGPPDPIAIPPIETLTLDNSALPDRAAWWLDNCYFSLPDPGLATGFYQNADLAAYADQVLTLVNAERAKVGVAPLTRDVHLDAVAQAHVRDNGLRDYDGAFTLDENGVATTFGPTARLDAVDSAPRAHAGLNLSAGGITPEETVSAWLNSPAQPPSILKPEFTSAGVGVYLDADPNDFFGVYWGLVLVHFTGDPNAHDWVETNEG
jgi:uncharacterized protein YkwD